MDEKKFAIVSILCLFVSIFLSVLIFWESIVFLNIVNECYGCIEEIILIQNRQNYKEKISEAIHIEQPEKIKEKISLGEFRLTAYCPCEKCCGEWALKRPTDENGNQIVYGSSGEILASGQSIAVDPAVIPYGSEVEINGEIYVAHDCGGAIKGNKIDIYFDNHQSALNFGVQHSQVFLVEG